MDKILSFYAPFELWMDIPVIKVSIKGKEYYMVLDTGASYSCIDKSILEENEFEMYNKSLTISTLGGMKDMMAYVTNDIMINGTEFHAAFNVDDLKAVFQHSGDEANAPLGILGNEFFDAYGIVIDYKKKAIYTIE